MEIYRYTTTRARSHIIVLSSHLLRHLSVYQQRPSTVVNSSLVDTHAGVYAKDIHSTRTYIYTSLSLLSYSIYTSDVNDAQI